MGAEANVIPLSPQERLQERLNDPQTVDSLNRLLDRLDVITFSFDALEGFLQRAEVVIDSLTSGVNELRPALSTDDQVDWIGKVPQLAQTGARLSDVAERVDWDALLASGLLEKLSDPKTLAAFGTMLEKIDLLAFMVESVDGFLARSEAIAETVVEGTHELRESIPKIDTEQLRQATERLPELLEAGEVLSAAGMFDPRTVQVLGELGRTIADSHLESTDGDAPARSVGVFGLLKVLRDPMVQNTLQLGIDVAQRYGAKLESDRNS
ncbi:MAG: hypothetical protein AAGD38_09650 [Acidobacteriota bacterium]